MTRPRQQSVDPVAVVATSLVLLGVLANKWLLAWVFTSDRNIRQPAIQLLIVMLQVFLILLGVALHVLKRDRRKLRNAAVHAGIWVLAVILCIVAAETFLRYDDTSHRDAVGLFSDQARGRKLRPNYRGSVRVGRKSVVLATNSFGMRWRETTYANPLGKERIAFAGDSFTFGEWADRIETTFVGVFDSLLDRQRYEVLNFGVPSYGMLEVRDQLRDDIVPFHPRYLVLMFYNGNDFTDTYLGIDRFKLVNGLPQWDSLVVNGRVPSALPAADLAGPALQRWMHDTLTSTHLFLFFDRMATAENCKRRPFLPSAHFMSFTYWSRTDSPPHLAAAVDTTMRVLDDIRRICQASEIRLALVSIPTEEQVYADQEAGDGYDTRLPQKYLAEFVRARAIPFLDLLPPLRLQASQHDSKLYVPNDPHFTNEGHRLAGLQLSSFFRSLEDRGPPAKPRP